MPWKTVIRICVILPCLMWLLLVSIGFVGPGVSAAGSFGVLAPKRGGGRDNYLIKLWCKYFSAGCVNQVSHHQNSPLLTRMPRKVNSSSNKNNNNKLSDRIDCLPEKGRWGDRAECERRGCIYDAVTPKGGPPPCYFPPQERLCGGGYSVESISESSSGIIANLAKRPSSCKGPFVLRSHEFQYLTFKAEFQTDYRLRIRISPTNQTRFEVPIKIPVEDGGSRGGNNTFYHVDVGQNSYGHFYFKVIRKSTNATIFDTDLPGFVFSNQFIQLPAKLPSKYIYGFGENQQDSYRHDLNWKTWVGYTRDQQAMFGKEQRTAGANMYGVHPTYTVMETELPGLSHQVLLLNSNAQEWHLTPNPALVYRTTGGLLDLCFFMGPSPQEAARQYSEAIGRYYVPPYWSLGFHICRFGYWFLSEMKSSVNRNHRMGIPQDVQCGDVDIMEVIGKNFSVSKGRFGGLYKYLSKMKRKSGLRFMPYVEPFIIASSAGVVGKNLALKSGDHNRVWIGSGDKRGDFVGTAWWTFPAKWPDFTKNVTKEWWKTMLVNYRKKLPYDGVYTDLNEPINFGEGEAKLGKCRGNLLNYPPYTVRTQDDLLSDDTICPDARLNNGVTMYDAHNLYGWSQSEPTLEGVRVATSERGFVITRSSFVGSGKWAAHWFGDNFSTWKDMHHSIIKMLQFNRFSMPMVGADICGFWDPKPGSTTSELCTRWHQLGAFYPLSRNHNGFPFPRQDPAMFDKDTVENIKIVLRQRYLLLPHLYTLFFKHSTTGSTVVRSLWEEFPEDRKTWDIDDQFMWGSAILITPILGPGEKWRPGYLPGNISTRWYDMTRWSTSGKVKEVKRKVPGIVKMAAPLHLIPWHLRGDQIIPTHYADNRILSTSMAVRNSAWTILVALDGAGVASGELFLDDGVSIDTVGKGLYSLLEFQAKNGTLTWRILNNGYSRLNSQRIKRIEVFGHSGQRPHIVLDRLEVPLSEQFEIKFA